MARTRDVRAELVLSVLAGRSPPTDNTAELADALRLLEEMPGDLRYETSELEKDLVFLRDGPKALFAHLAELHRDSGFESTVGQCAETLGGRVWNAFVTDRDGTINNYCSRYRSSVQSVYNAVLLTRFVRSLTRSAVIITSGPLAGPGILDLVVEPPGTFIYGASKAREYVDRDGTRRTYPVDAARQERLDDLNRRLTELLSRPENETFALIGSGFQTKFGQTTVARQDITGSTSAEDSERFLAETREIVRSLDPEGAFFVIEDTGLDIEIILTVAGDSPRDFDKGDGLRFLDKELGLGLDRGGNLVAGDTGSDVRMLEAALASSADTRAVFVTGKPDLAGRVRALEAGALIVPEPDILVAALGVLAGAFDS